MFERQTQNCSNKLERGISYTISEASIETSIGIARILLIRESIRFDSPFNSDRFYEMYIDTRYSGYNIVIFFIYFAIMKRFAIFTPRIIIRNHAFARNLDRHVENGCCSSDSFIFRLTDPSKGRHKSESAGGGSWSRSFLPQFSRDNRSVSTKPELGTLLGNGGSISKARLLSPLEMEKWRTVGVESHWCWFQMRSALMLW